MELLDNPIKSYAWGDTTAIAHLLGRAPTGQPHAELWLGAHASDPSRRVGDGQRLDALIAADPVAMLGAPSVERFGPALPFLLKVLAAAKPLSLQAHPSLAQARAGFAAEQASGLSLDAPTRNYKDANHKPEVICALTPFHALCGFRRLSDTVRLFRALELPTATLETKGLKAYFQEVMTAPVEARKALARRAAQACATGTGHESERRWALLLAQQHPDDVGLIGALLLNLVTLEPGEALYLPAGNLHAYLGGVGIELMASSDNVLRGGLTPKHVDVPELLKVLNFDDGPVQIIRPTGGAYNVYPTSARDFELARLTLRTPDTLALERRGAEVFFVTSGEVRLSSPKQALVLPRGAAAFVAADEGALTVSGAGEAFRATVGRFETQPRPGASLAANALD